MNLPAAARTAPLPPRFKDLIHGCRLMARGHLTPVFATMLENADVALLEFADKAESNTARGRCFEAMHELKRRRDDVHEAFLNAVDAGFRNFIEGGVAAKPAPPGPEDLRANKLRLVEKHEVEARLPVQNMAAKANATYSEPLYGLNQRLAVINGGARLAEADLPGGPVQLAEAALAAFALMSIDPSMRVVIYAVFDRSVMRELRGLYDEYNRRLVNAGVLPNLKYEIRKLPDPRPVKQHSPAVPAASSSEQSVGDEVFQSILEFMRASRTASAPAQRGRADDDLGNIVAAGARIAILGAIDRIRQEQGAAEANQRFQEEIVETNSIDASLLDKLKAGLSEDRQRVYSGLDRRRVASADADVVDLVGMMFEFMLQDDQLPNAVKALLSRLHTPYLKVAVIDRQLFTERAHPARRLLDRMVEAGARWVTEDDLSRGIFPCMRNVVERILRELTDDIGLFDELLDDFSAHVREVEQKASMIERRSVETADGQARLQAARERSGAEIGAALRGASLVPEAESFMRQVWREKLTFILLREREGEHSDAWRLATSLAQLLVWSFSPVSDTAERDSLHEALPGLRGQVRDGLERLQGYGRRDNDKMFTQICGWQEQALDPRFTQDSRGVEGQVSHAGAPPEMKIEVPLPPSLQSILDRLGHLAFDTWFEFSDMAGGRPRRLKLAWYSKISSNYMFVDAMGVKAVEYTRMDLAKRLDGGQARILELQDKPFLDRALEAVLSWLGRNGAETAR